MEKNENKLFLLFLRTRPTKELAFSMPHKIRQIQHAYGFVYAVHLQFLHFDKCGLVPRETQTTPCKSGGPGIGVSVQLSWATDPILLQFGSSWFILLHPASLSPRVEAQNGSRVYVTRSVITQVFQPRRLFDPRRSSRYLSHSFVHWLIYMPQWKKWSRYLSSCGVFFCHAMVFRKVWWRLAGRAATASQRSCHGF